MRISDWSSDVCSSDLEQREGYGPQIRMADATRALFFAGQPLATHSPIGTTKTLQAATAKRLQAFHDRWYRPENVEISIAGDGDQQMFEQNVRQYFADWMGKGTQEHMSDSGMQDGHLPNCAGTGESSVGEKSVRTC